jgi:hypothetical protein
MYKVKYANKNYTISNQNQILDNLKECTHTSTCVGVELVWAFVN